MATLGVPLAEESIEREITRDGKSVVEVVQIGKKMVQFKKSVEKDKARLDDNWKQWEELQNDFIELGLEVFGNEAFGPEQAYQEIERGYKHDMEVIAQDLKSGMKALNEEIEDITAKTMTKLKSQEKVRSQTRNSVCTLLMPVTGARECCRKGSATIDKAHLLRVELNVRFGNLVQSPAVLS